MNSPQALKLALQRINAYKALPWYDGGLSRDERRESFLHLFMADLHHNDVYCYACRTTHGERLITYIDEGHQSCYISEAWEDAHLENYDPADGRQYELDWLALAESLTKKSEPVEYKHVALCGHIVYTYDNFKPMRCQQCREIEEREER